MDEPKDPKEVGKQLGTLVELLKEFEEGPSMPNDIRVGDMLAIERERSLPPPPGGLGSILGFWTAWVGALLSGISLMSAFVRIYQVGLNAFVSELVSTFRGATQPIVNIVNSWPLPFQLTPFAIEMILVYLTLFTISARTLQTYSWRRPVSVKVLGKEATLNVGFFSKSIMIISLWPIFTLLPLRNYLSAKKGLRYAKELPDTRRMANLRKILGPMAYPVSKEGMLDVWKGASRYSWYACLQVVLPPLIVVLLLVINMFPPF
ncbi:hypothetical protein SLH49_03185 [Cognatiyoonia sp. IB215446]|uniref:hypothetical protein n=1 Tax=Cognatiyoonia sp. IB215446 TaxID=3097355 RepID=UPI002A13E36F|nr:hypothetical protein [Cognatiyoonia sp. IB215446]MDX8346981.1 hypothetical protein [Cognatiyoonia sp. IB215446]